MVLTREPSVSRWVRQANDSWFVIYATVMAFGLYTCVYAFRKTFSVATFEGIYFAGVSYKVWLVTFQVIGYALSKFVGIKVISELKATSRFTGILLMVSIAGISWLLFALVPRPYNIVFLFTNGFPLGLVWGMIFVTLKEDGIPKCWEPACQSALFFSWIREIIRRVYHAAVEHYRQLDALHYELHIFYTLVGLLWLLDKLQPRHHWTNCFAQNDSR